MQRSCTVVLECVVRANDLTRWHCKLSGEHHHTGSPTAALSPNPAIAAWVEQRGGADQLAGLTTQFSDSDFVLLRQFFSAAFLGTRCTLSPSSDPTATSTTTSSSAAHHSPTTATTTTTTTTTTSTPRVVLQRSRPTQDQYAATLQAAVAAISDGLRGPVASLRQLVTRQPPFSDTTVQGDVQLLLANCDVVESAASSFAAHRRFAAQAPPPPAPLHDFPPLPVGGSMGATVYPSLSRDTHHGRTRTVDHAASAPCHALVAASADPQREINVVAIAATPSTAIDAARDSSAACAVDSRAQPMLATAARDTAAATPSEPFSPLRSASTPCDTAKQSSVAAGASRVGFEAFVCFEIAVSATCFGLQVYKCI